MSMVSYDVTVCIYICIIIRFGNVRMYSIRILNNKYNLKSFIYI